MREQHNIASLAIDEPSSLKLSLLPALHKDPFDHILMCQAIVHGLVILTPDPLIQKYPVQSAW